jgi:hypothetical protein
MMIRVQSEVRMSFKHAQRSCQINLLGLRFGRKVGVFFEVDAGTKGMFLGGLGARFWGDA